MKRTVLLYSLSLAILVITLKLLDFRFMVHSLSIEIYLSLVSILFAALGIWAGTRLTRPKPHLVPETDFQIESERLEKIGISKREYEVLELMARGLSNQEIADTLFVSLNTVKTHSSSLYLKLDTRRRTQAVQKARELKLIP